MKQTQAPGGVWRLRPDLELVRSVAANGAPTLLAHDPVTETFDRVEWPEVDLILLLRDGATLEELRERFAAHCTLRATARDIAEYLGHVAEKGWLASPRARQKKFVSAAEARGARGGGGAAGAFAALSLRLFFVQIPLARPDAFLRAVSGAAGLFWSPACVAAVLLACVAGVCLALPRWEEFLAVVSASANLAGAPGFLLALVGLKCAHEFAHACAATLAGARVRTMGVAFFFLMPLPFTDVTDAWRLEWPARLRIASAGLFAELAVGSAALLLWALAPPGEAAAVCARVATVAVLSTLATNLNPGLRFDGYFILVCLTKVENLRAKGMAALRAALWLAVFGIRGAAGAGKMSAGLCVYAVYAVAYRIAIGAALTALAYAFLPKALGLPVAAVAVGAFFLAPAAREAVFLWKRRGGMRFTAGTGMFAALLLAGGVWFFGSWPRRISFPAVTRAGVEEAVRARRAGVIRRVLAVRGDVVAEGQVLAELDVPEEEFLLARAEWAVREAEIVAGQAWAGALARRGSAPREAERERREDELAALRAQSALLGVRASASGVLADWDEALAPGVAVGEGSVLGFVVLGNGIAGGAGGGVRADYLACYPEVEAAGRFDAGTEAWFWPDSGGGALRGAVVAVGETVVAGVEDRELAPALAAAVPALPRVRVLVRLDAPADRVGQAGVVRVASRPESLAARVAAWMGKLAVRESAL